MGHFNINWPVWLLISNLQNNYKVNENKLHEIAVLGFLN